MPRQNGFHFADDFFKFIFMNEKFEFQIKFHWILFLKIQLTSQHSSIDSDNGLAPIRHRAIIKTNDGVDELIDTKQDHMCMYVRLRNDTLTSGSREKTTTHICITRPQWVYTILSMIYGLTLK